MGDLGKSDFERGIPGLLVLGFSPAGCGEQKKGSYDYTVTQTPGRI